MAFAMTEAGACDVLFVVHRRTPLARVVAAARACSAQRIGLLTTHHPFAHERSALTAALAPAGVVFHTFADLLDDTTLAAIDDDATAALRTSSLRRTAYTTAFQHQMTRRKNAAAYAALRARGPIRRVFAAHGLGIDAHYWREQGATLLETPTWKELLQRSAVWHQLHAWNARRPRTGTVVRDGPDGYLFVAGLNRLRVRPGTPTTVMPLRAALADPTVRYVATALHDDPAFAHRLGRPVRVFVDGHLPTNYPRTYADALSDAEFVCGDPFAVEWLSRHGRKTVPLPAFVTAAEFNPAVAPTAIRNVVCLLNHAGDWSALINRSDTDVLAEEFTRLATAFPSLHFVLRPHPGMDHPRHEGAGGLARLAELVRRAASPNLEYSLGPLAADLTRGDLFISEYSSTLIEAWRSGKLGLVANLTRRRSLMQDFADLGFPSVATSAELRTALESAVASPGLLAARQTAATTRCNALFAP
jgi:hypothetical protein